MNFKEIILNTSIMLLVLTLPIQALSATSLGSFSNSAGIIIDNTDSATPYPSTITVSGVTGPVGKVRVTLNNVSHEWPEDTGVLLVGPQGQKIVLMDGVGGNTGILGTSLVFDDTGSSLTIEAIASGTYRPTNLNTTDFPSPAPAGPYPETATLSTFNNIAPNGVWQLYVRDSFPEEDFGTISGGWEIEFLSPSFTVSGVPTTIAAGVPFDLTVTAINQNGSTNSGYSGSIYFTSTAANSTLPAPYAFVPGDNGSHTFSFILYTSGSQTITVFDDTIADLSGTSAPITITTGVQVSISTAAGTPQGAAPDATYSVPLKAVVRDLNGNPVAGVQVTFDVVPAAGAGGMFTGNLSSVSATTDVSGIATAPAFTANSVIGGFTVTATANGIDLPAVFNLTNFPPPIITSQPQPVTILAGQIPNLSVTATSTETITYQWYQGAKGETSSPVPSATLPAFNMAVSSTGTYWVRVTGISSVDSEAVLVTVNHPALITVQPEPKFIQSGQSATLNVSASGDGISYQWYLGISGNTTSPIPGATTSSYTTPPLYGPTSYWVRITGTYGPPADSSSAQAITAIATGTAGNNSSIAITDNSTANPYPSTIIVSNDPGPFDTIRVTLTGVNHSYPEDIGVLLVGPGGQKVVLMNRTGGDKNLVNTTLVFDDAGSALTDAPIVSGTYRPTDLNPSGFPSPAPAGPYDSGLAVFKGTDPRGTWSLYIIDAAGGDDGNINGGWQIEFIQTMLSLKIIFAGNGKGSVHYQEQATTINTTHETSVTSGAQVTLEPIIDQYSRFDGWSGVSNCTTGTCQFTMNSNATATATFTLDSTNSVLVDPIRYGTIDAAYKAGTTLNNATIKLWGINFTENLLLDENKAVTLEGGYNSSYSTQTSGVFTTITGTLTIRDGKMTVERVILKPN